jgi:hypothetical protein
VNLETEIVGLSLAYVLLAVLLLLALTRALLPWPLKAAAIALTSAFYVIAFFRTEGLLGWSSPGPLPQRFQLLWVRTVDPDRALDDPGAIHLWLEEIDDANLPSGVPRAYRLPYSTALARKAEAARVEIVNGHPQAGRALDFASASADAPPDTPVTPPRAGEPGESGGDPSTGLFDPAMLGGLNTQSVDFVPLPPPRLPPKDAPAPDTGTP